ncbi:MAB_1171c family putative transporter [Kitasatospora sp. NRRL B-11411]|uniref:MAB_1171c family putative transporter n=1 Tax=Kitasatospora sp. NRRL B-11411 TaxID=1463822 RepID=UPI0004C2CA8B|nr:MAB_1171c family putative transporter [Kitasatospora sp. NRRL B-11411]
MISLITFGLPALLLAAAAFWMRPRPDGVPRPSNAVATAVLLVAWAIAIIGFNPLVQDAADLVTRDLAKLISNALMLCASLAVVGFLFALNHDPAPARAKLRPRLRLLALTVAVMSAAFFSTPADRRWSSPFTNTHWGQAPVTLAVYTIAYVAFMGHATYDALVQTWRRSTETDWRVHKIGLKAVASGCSFVLVYLLYKVVNSAASLAHVELFPGGPRCTSPVTPYRCAFSFTAPLTGVLLITAGLTVPAMLWPLAKRRLTAWQRQTAQIMAPLWQDLTSVDPDVVLATLGDDAEPDLVLHRRTVEIADGILSLEEYRSRAVKRAAEEAVADAGITGIEADAVVEATVVAGAIQAARWGARAQYDPAPLADQGSAREADLGKEAVWLRLVAEQYTSNEIVHRIAAAHQPPALDAA